MEPSTTTSLYDMRKVGPPIQYLDIDQGYLSSGPSSPTLSTPGSPIEFVVSKSLAALSLSDDVGYDSGSSIASGSPPSSPPFQPAAVTNNGVCFFYCYDAAFQPVTVYYDVPMPMPMIYAAPLADNVQYQEPQSPVEYQEEEPCVRVVVPKSPFRANRQIKWNLPPPVVPDFELPGWEMMPYHLEHFWQSSFAYFFAGFYKSTDHVWTLTPVHKPPMHDDGWLWHEVSYSAKVRFQCQYKHGWTSMKGRVVFWYRMRRQGDEIVAETLFKLYGQQCNRCNNQQKFFTPLWYHEEIENAVRFLFIEIAKTYYGGEKLPAPRRIRQGCFTRRDNQQHHHMPDRCQACHDGVCVIRI